MKTSWMRCAGEFKSPLRVVVRFVLRSRETKADKCRKLKRELDESQRLLARQRAEHQRQRQEIRELKQQIQRLETENRLQARAARLLPIDPPLGAHGYGAQMVKLSVALAQAVGFRRAVRVSQVFFEWLGVNVRVPHRSTIRTWLQRLGVAAMKEPFQQADDWIWMADHSNQIGPEKTLVVLGVRASQLRPRGEPLKHDDLRVLTVRPGTAWKRENVAAVYAELAEQYGTPRAVLTDGAVELREGAECLKNRRCDTIVLQDFKHKAANFLRTFIGKDERFAEFHARLGRTRSAIQQTELAHLTPPGQKPKARFMNLQDTLNWAAATLWLLEHPQAQTRRWLTPERLEDKLGWLRSFAEDLPVWCECQRIVDRGLKLINEEGLFRGAGRQLRAAVAPHVTHATSQRLADALVDFVTAAESQLKEEERLPMSTEILESSFGLYKQLEGQHSKGGFTSLLAAFGALLRKPTTKDIKQAFESVSVKDMNQWVNDNLGHTLTSKRVATYQEYKRSTRSATKLATAS